MIAAVLAALSILLTAEHAQSSPDVKEIERLEVVWNDAHLGGNVPALEALCDDELVVTVPGMKTMTKADILGFWKTGKAKIITYDTSDVHVDVRGATAVATGRLNRTRDFNGTVMTDLWQYTKMYARRGSGWVVVAYQAVERPKRRKRGAEHVTAQHPNAADAPRTAWRRAADS